MSDSEIENINTVVDTDDEEVVSNVVETAPKPKKKTKKKKVKKSDEEHSTEDSDREDSNEKKSKKSKKSKKKGSGNIEPSNDNHSNEEPSNDDIAILKEELNVLKEEHATLKKTLEHIVDTLASVGGKMMSEKSSEKRNKNTRVKDKSYVLSALNHNQVQSLVIRKENWGDFDEPDDKEEKRKVQVTKPKNPEDIANEKLRDFVIEQVSNHDLLEELEIELDDGKITTHNVTKMIKNHCENNDFLINKNVPNQHGEMVNKKHYNLTEGDFEDMFEEYVSSD